MPNASIFVSYRQSDTRAWVVSLRDELTQAFGDEAVFVDTDSLDAGRWSEQIDAALSECRVLLVVMGAGWLAACGTDGRRRLDDPQDVHRREIEHGLQRRDVLVLPLLVDGAAMPAAASLPATLMPLTESQSLTWSRRADHRALDRARLLEAIRRQTGLAPRQADWRSRWSGPALVLAIGVGGTLGLGLAFSMIGMPLDTAETLVTFVLCTVVAATAMTLRTRWRRLLRLR